MHSSRIAPATHMFLPFFQLILALPEPIDLLLLGLQGLPQACLAPSQLPHFFLQLTVLLAELPELAELAALGELAWLGELGEVGCELGSEVGWKNWAKGVVCFCRGVRLVGWFGVGVGQGKGEVVPSLLLYPYHFEPEIGVVDNDVVLVLGREELK